MLKQVLADVPTNVEGQGTRIEFGGTRISANCKFTNTIELKSIVCEKFGIVKHLETLEIIPCFSDANVNRYCTFYFLFLFGVC